MKKIIIFLILMVLMLASVGLCDDTLDANCIGSWLLNEASGTIYDESANNIDSTSQSGTFSYNVSGKVGTSLDFTDGEIDFGDVTIFDGISKFSMSCYLFIDALPANSTTISIMRKDGTFTPLQLAQTSSVHSLKQPIWNSSGTLIQNQLNYTLPTGRWICLQSIWDKDVNGGKTEFFLDGVSIGSGSTGCTTTAYASGTKAMHFGRTETGTEPFNGKVDEVEFFNDVRTETERNNTRLYGVKGADTLSFDEGTGISFRSSATANTATASSLTITKPTGTVDGDVMIAIINANDSATTITPPTGWTLIRSITSGDTISANISTYYKAASSEGADYQFSFSASVRAAGAISTFIGVRTTDVIDVENGRTTISNTNKISPDITTTEDNTMLVFLTAADSGTTINHTPPIGMIEAADSGSVSGCEIAYFSKATSGATGTYVGISSSVAISANFLLALNKANTSSTVRVNIITTGIGSGIGRGIR